LNYQGFIAGSYAVAIKPYGIETGIVGVSLYKTKDTPKPSLPLKVA
jgi:hypothetical protein